MYKAVCDGVTIYDDMEPDKDLNLVSPKLVLEDSAAGTFEFTMPPNSRAYDILSLSSSDVTVYRDGEEIWSGRPMTEKRDFLKRRQIYCEGELAFLNDTYQPQKAYSQCLIEQFMQAVLDIHNTKVDERRRFVDCTFSGIPNYGESTIRDWATDYVKTIDIVNNICSEFGYHVRVRKDAQGRHLDFSLDPFRTNLQTIEFGKNLIDYTVNYDMTNLITALLPLGEVKTNAGEQTIGEEVSLTKRENKAYVLHDDVRGIVEETVMGSYYTATVNLHDESISPGDKVYITSRHHGGFVMWFFQDTANPPNTISHHEANTGLGFTDLFESELEVPAGAALLHVAGFGWDIPLRVNKQAQMSEQFDTYTDVSSVNNGSVYVTAQPKNRFLTNVIQNGSRAVTTDLITLEQSNWTFSCQYKGTLQGDLMVDVKRYYNNGTSYISTETYEMNDFFTFLANGTDENRWSFRFEFYSSVEGEVVEPNDILFCQIEVGTTPTYYESPIGPMQTYGWIEGQVTWDDISDPNQLLIKAREYLSSGQFDGMQLEIKAIDMRVLGADVDALRVMDEIRVISKPHGLDRLFPVSKLEIPLDDPQNMIFTLTSKPSQNLYSSSSGIDESLSAKIAAAPTMSQTLAAARKNASALIRNNDTGVITFIKDRDGNNREMQITNTADWEAATSGWKINYQGIGYYGDGFDHDVTIAITGPNGGIVANSITTGTMAADRIYGGTLRLGHWPNVDTTVTDGLIEVRNANGDLTGRLSRDGFQTWLSNEGYNYEVAIKENSIFGYVIENGVSKEASRVMPATVWDLDGRKYGYHLEADVLSIDTNHLMLRNSEEAYDSTVRLLGADGTTRYTLAFHKGWLLSVTED